MPGKFPYNRHAAMSIPSTGTACQWPTDAEGPGQKAPAPDAGHAVGGAPAGLTPAFADGYYSSPMMLTPVS